MVKKKLFQDIRDSPSRRDSYHSRGNFLINNENGQVSQYPLSTPPRIPQSMDNLEDTIEISNPLQSTARFNRNDDSDSSNGSPISIMSVEQPRHYQNSNSLFSFNQDHPQQQELFNAITIREAHRSWSNSQIFSNQPSQTFFQNTNSQQITSQTCYWKQSSQSFGNQNQRIQKNSTAFQNDISKIQQSRMIENNIHKIEVKRKEVNPIAQEESPGEKKVSRLLRNGVGQFVPQARGMEVENIRGSQTLCNNQNSLNISNTSRNSICYFNQKGSTLFYNNNDINLLNLIRPNLSGKEDYQNNNKNNINSICSQKRFANTNNTKVQNIKNNRILSSSQSLCNNGNKSSINDYLGKLELIDSKTRQIKKKNERFEQLIYNRITKKKISNLEFRRSIKQASYVDKLQSSSYFDIFNTYSRNDTKYQYTHENFPHLCASQLQINPQKSQQINSKRLPLSKQLVDAKFANICMLSMSIFSKKECRLRKEKINCGEKQIKEITPFEKLKNAYEGRQFVIGMDEISQFSKYQRIFQRIKTQKIRKRQRKELGKKAEVFSRQKGYVKTMYSDKDKDHIISHFKHLNSSICQETKHQKNESTNDKTSTHKKSPYMGYDTFGQQETPKTSEFRISIYQRPFTKKYKILIDNYECGRLKWWWTKWKILLENRYCGEVKFQQYTSFLEVNNALIRDLLKKQKKVADLFKNSRQISKYFDFKRSYSKNFMIDNKRNFNQEQGNVLILPLKLQLPKGYDYFYQNYYGNRITKLVIFNEFAQISYKEDVMILERSERERDLRKKIRFGNDGIWIGCEMLKKKCEFMFFGMEERQRSLVDIHLAQDEIGEKIIPFNSKDCKVYKVSYDSNVPERLYGQIDWVKRSNQQSFNDLKQSKFTAILFPALILLIIYLLL